MDLACGQLVDAFGEHAKLFVLRFVYVRHEHGHRPADDGHLRQGRVDPGRQELVVSPELVEHVTDDGRVELGGDER
ncbi:hypothetical protein [Streptomyces nigrescens]|uniref:Uncharacterized protein n=1 Tax=Streptomyces nigrescens TaxID=1920 RepID=A0ABY7IXV0_STRNI|nr:hypothetical protein [Streptomyces nigrescens]WAU03796.1 hypothetical protein STRNI_001986 [Streptomyces nigrescens]